MNASLLLLLTFLAVFSLNATFNETSQNCFMERAEREFSHTSNMFEQICI